MKKLIAIVVGIVLSTATIAIADPTPTPAIYISVSGPSSPVILGNVYQVYWYFWVSNTASATIYEEQEKTKMTNIASWPTPVAVATNAVYNTFTWNVAEGYSSITKTVKYKSNLFDENIMHVVAGSRYTNLWHDVTVVTATRTPSISPTITKTTVPNWTRTVTKTVTPSSTATETTTPTITLTHTASPTLTHTLTSTLTATESGTITVTITPSLTFTPTASITPTNTNTPVVSATTTSTITPTYTVTTIPTMYVKYVSNVAPYTDKIKIEFSNYNGASYTLGYGTNTEILNDSDNIAKSQNRFVYEISDLITTASYAISLTATGGDLGTNTQTSNVIVVKPVASPTP